MKIIIKNRLSQFLIKLSRAFYYPLFLITARNNDFRVKSPSETVDEIIRKNLSVSRFGDGEFNIMFRGKSIGFQKYSRELSESLFAVHTGKNNIIAIPHGLFETKHDKFLVKTFWWSYLVKNNKLINKFVNSKENLDFYDASFSRVVTELKDKDEIRKIVDKVKGIWNNKNVIMVEGSQTRFGVSNDLFNKAKSVSRIIAPNENAYNMIQEIESKVDELLSKFKDAPDKVIVLIALGPTASVLAYRLCNHVQAVDIGHFDLQYEFYRRGFYHKVRISDRYDNEALGRNSIQPIQNTEYIQQIYCDLSRKE